MRRECDRTGAVLSAGLAVSLLLAAPAAAEMALTPELQAVKDAMERYRDPTVAIRDGYFSTLGCVVYEAGGMGVHFLNPQLFGPVPDPMQPQLLVYEPDADGMLHLVALEWFIPLSTGVEGRPELFGQPFDGPMKGHEPLIPEEVHHYDLHVWLWKDNPAGMFHAVNPDVTCEGHPYRLLEVPPDIVPHH